MRAWNDRFIVFGGLLALSFCLCLAVVAGRAAGWQQSEVSPSEMQLCHQWVQQNLLAVGAPATPSMTVVSSSGAPFSKNVPVTLGGQSFKRGLFTQAPFDLAVHLPGKAASLTAVTGIATVSDTAGGKGSVTFVVKAGENVLYQSPIVHEGTATPISVDLQGATDIRLQVTDGGDGNDLDQAVWADAKVTLADGQEIWLGDAPTNPEHAAPFSLSIGNTPSSVVFNGQPCQLTSTAIDAQRTRHTLRWIDPASGLEIRCEAVEYLDYPTVEWTLWLKNTGTTDTPPLSNIQALNCKFQRPQAAHFLLHHFDGSHQSLLDYRPCASELSPGMTTQFHAGGGRPTNGDQGGSMPYYNLDFGGEGMVMAIGWPGQWSSSFTRTAEDSLQVTGGLQDAHFVLHPGEEVRSPLVVLQFWQGGDWVRAQNIWRRWMRAHNLPRPNGELPPVLTFVGGSEGLRRTAAGELKDLADLQKNKLHFDYWWMDAGWYTGPDTHWWFTGDWVVDKNRYPNGIREVSDKAHAMGMKTLLWFEPERALVDSGLDKQHHDWLIILPCRADRLLNIGNSAAWQWTLDMVDGTMQREGIDLYRQDFNTDPLPFWQQADVPNRAGMTEMQYVMGYLALWDELHRRHPNMIIDSCSSGGRRNDLETLRRGVPLLRSDEQANPESQQNHTYGISFWMPYDGTGIGADDLYHLRSAYTPGFATGGNPQLVGKALAEVHPVQLAMRDGDYYPLTKYDGTGRVWVAWQFDVPETGSGVVQAFRRTGCKDAAIMLKLRGLDPAAKYSVRNIDETAAVTRTGAELMRGLRVALPETSAAIIEYTKVK